MKKTVFLLIAIATAFPGCQDTGYTSYLSTMSMDNVTKVSLNPNSPVLVADGVAELKFIVKVYMTAENERTVEVIVDGENVVEDREFTTETLVKPDRLSGDDITITSSRGETIENYTFSTDTGAGTEIEFTCKIGNMTSLPCKVRLIEKPAAYTKEIVVPVILHILSETGTVAACNSIDGEKLSAHLEHANNVFGGRQYPTAPAIVDSKISFVPATHDPDGKLLAEPGIDRHDFGDQFYEVYYENQKAYMWDPDKYLNIYVYNSWSNSASGPSFILSGVGQFPGFTELTVVDDPSEAEYADEEGDYEWGILIWLDEFMNLGKAGNSIRFESLLGDHYGLIGTMYASWLPHWTEAGDADYCSDTYTYRSVNMSIEKITYVPSGSADTPIYYNSFNIMDGSTTSSAITPEQVARVRFVIEHCPGRMAGW